MTSVTDPARPELETRGAAPEPDAQRSDAQLSDAQLPETQLPDAQLAQAQVPAAQVPAAAWAGHPGYAVPEPDRLTRFVQRVWMRSPVWAAPAAMFACMAGAVGYTLVSNPTAAGADAVPTCLLRYATGFDCPGCGGTRAAWFLLHGDLPAAARHHLLFVFVVPFLLYLYVAWAGRVMFGWRLPQLQLGPGVIGGFLAAWGVFSILRNLPWAPFHMFFV